MSGVESIGSSEEVIDSGYEEELVVLSITGGEKPKKKKKASKDKKKKGKKDKKDAKGKKGRRREEHDGRHDGRDRATGRGPDREACAADAVDATGAAEAAYAPAAVRASALRPGLAEQGSGVRKQAAEAPREPQEPWEPREPQPAAPGAGAEVAAAPETTAAEAPAPEAAAWPQAEGAEGAVLPPGLGANPGAGPRASAPSEGSGAIKDDPEVPAEANPEDSDSDVMEIGRDDDDDDDLEVLGGEEALAAVKARVEAAAAKAAAREKRKAEEATARKLRKLEEAAAKERKRVEEERRRAEERAQREEATRLEAQRRMAQEAAGREALRQKEAELRERRGAELREAQQQLQRREAERAAMLQAAQRELLQREAERERAKRKAVGNVKFDEAGSFANFSSFNAKRSLSDAHGQSDKKARTDGAGSTDDSSNDSEDSQDTSEQEGQVNRNPTKFRPPSLWTDASAALQDDTQQVDWDSSPAELLPRGEVPTAAAFVEHFARFAVGAWRRELQRPVPFEGKTLQETELAVFRSRQSLQQIEGAVGPLIKQLARNKANEEIVKQLDTMVTLAAEREYAEAGAAYITLALGHKKWNQTHATYAGAVCQNKGCRTYKTYQDKLLEYDKDPVVQKYIQCMRKLVHFVQCIRPNDDVAKHLHI